MVTSLLAPSLPDLARRANAEHAGALGSGETFLAHCRAAGNHLIEAKSRVRHGEWEDWCEEHLSFSGETACRYMRVARGWERLPPNPSRATDLSQRGALALLTRDESPDEDLDDLERIDRELSAMAGLEDRAKARHAAEALAERELWLAKATTALKSALRRLRALEYDDLLGQVEELLLRLAERREA